MDSHYSFVLLGTIVIISVVQITRAQVSCPGNGDGCLQQAGINPGIGDVVKFCTETPKKLDEAGFCLRSCGYEATPLYRQTIDNLASTCSALAGCENFAKDYETFRTCYNSTDELKTLVDVVIFKYNSRALQMEDCIKLRTVRSCLKRASRKCSYLDKIFDDLSESLVKFDISSLICGAENVDMPAKTDDCSSASNNIEANCNVACDLTSATTAGDVCKLLQKQSNCIYGFSEKCTDAQITHLLPRLASYSLINQLFLCNVSVDGVVILPSFGLECPYKHVLQQCFNIEVDNGIPLTTIKNLLNGDLPKYTICSKYGVREEAIINCSRSLWACGIPLARTYSRTTTESEFDRHLGTFPLSDLGLKLLLDDCNSEQPTTKACTSPNYAADRLTPSRLPKYTSGIKLQTPGSPSRN